MSKKLFTNKEIELLSKNKYIKTSQIKQSRIQMNLKYFLSLSVAKVNYLFIFFRMQDLIQMLLEIIEFGAQVKDGVIFIMNQERLD
ncbi:hypothetical protein DFH83_002047 [Clostridium saccharobutylicum]|nr:hypothetical protein [Clostridium saccharobutylicum]